MSQVLIVPRELYVEISVVKPPLKSKSYTQLKYIHNKTINWSQLRKFIMYIFCAKFSISFHFCAFFTTDSSFPSYSTPRCQANSTDSVNDTKAYIICHTRNMWDTLVTSHGKKCYHNSMWYWNGACSPWQKSALWIHLVNGTSSTI